jgi:hypothetical protein
VVVGKYGRDIPKIKVFDEYVPNNFHAKLK